MKHATVCSLVVITVIVLLLVTFCASGTAGAQSPLATTTFGPPPPYYTPGWHNPATRTPPPSLPAPISPLFTPSSPLPTPLIIGASSGDGEHNNAPLPMLLLPVTGADSPLCPSPTPTPTPPPNPVTITGFQASSPTISLPALIFGIVSTIGALVFAAWWWLHSRNAPLPQ